MFRVLVVDDEPSAVEYICNIIKVKCPELSVVATAENGEEGLLKFQEFMPDLVISDVKMSHMDGLDMVNAIKETGEEVSVVLVSGYQEFEYARAALKYGVSDYILKPVTPAGFAVALTPVIQVLNQRVYEQRKKLVRTMIAGGKVKKDKVGRYFTETSYYLAVIRENGLPRRFKGTREIEIASDLEDKVFVYGRDERETLYIYPGKAASINIFIKFIQKERKKRENESNFVTIVIMEEPISTEKLGEAVGRLYGAMNRRLSIGVTQMIFAKEDGTVEGRQKEGDRQTRKREIHGREILDRLEQCLEKRDYRRILGELSDLIKTAEEVKYPQLRLERLLRQFALKVQQHFDSRSDFLEEELMFEDAFYEAGTSEDLYNSLRSILGRYWKMDKESMKLDSPEFIEKIKEYVESHLSQELTVSSLCREFNLSQSYLNMIFRKHGMESFNTYLRNERIKRAKEIMERNPQMLVKDVAMMVGYKDQFYFSRIFRAVTGIAPSGYHRKQQDSGINRGPAFC